VGSNRRELVETSEHQTPEGKRLGGCKHRRMGREVEEGGGGAGGTGKGGTVAW